MPINQLINIKEKNKFNYKRLLSNPNIINDFNYDLAQADINIYIPVKGRAEHLTTCIRYLNNAISHTISHTPTSKIKMHIIENDVRPQHQKFANENSINYLFIPISMSKSNNMIAKALAFNVGYFASKKAKWNIFHDVDILVPHNFFDLLKTYMAKNPLWIQPFNCKRIGMLDHHISKEIISRTNEIVDLVGKLRTHKGRIKCNSPGAPGGSIVIRKDVFEKIGGYDPEIFYGYSPEDAFIWFKLESLAKNIPPFNNILRSSLLIHRDGAAYADNPPIQLFHVHHEPSFSRYEELNMSNYLEYLAKLTTEEKKKFLKKCEENLADTHNKKLPEEITINLFDDAFAHLETPDGKYSMVHAKKNEHIKYIKNRDYNELNNITIFTEDWIYSSEVDRIKSEYKIGWLIETRDVAPYRYEKVADIIDKFDFIMTHDTKLLETFPNKAKFLPFGGSWIRKEHFKIHNKSKIVSMIYSHKKLMIGHQFRHSVADRVSGIDLYGSGSGKHMQFKEEGLNDYAFSIILENSATENYFTEKLLDCFATGTVPIYWGCHNIGNFFNIDGIMRFSSVDELAKIVETLNIDLYQSKMEAIKDNFERVKKYEVVEDHIYNLLINEEIF